MGKINILVVPSDNVGGVGFYRSIQPHIEIDKSYKDEFEVTIDMHPDFSNLASFDKYDIIHIHKAVFPMMDLFYKALDYWKNKGIVTIMDIDDHWKLGPHHPQYHFSQNENTGKIITENLRRFDIITTTTPIFAKEIRKYNKNVFVLPNAIDPSDSRFQITKEKNDLLRIGLIMGSTHEHDVALLGNITNGLSKDVLDKIQFVLCGFDLRGSMKLVNAKTKEVTERPLEPKETVWYRYEKKLTDDYKTCSPQYKEFLNLFIPNSSFPNEKNEHYRRCWTKDINHYFQHYANVDVLLAPLEVTDFNLVKSQLKAIESCFSHTAIIASDFGPYQLDLVNYFEKGGNINPNGNALLVDKNKNHKQWKKYIETLVKHPEIVKTLQDNLYNSIKDKYNLQAVTKERVALYKNAVNNKFYKE